MRETELKIRLFGDALLRKKAKPVKQVTALEAEILSGMAKLMYAASGVGLAAPQVGVSEAMIVVDIGSGLYKLINPVIVKKEGTQETEEGCLSVPGICLKIKRSQKVRVEALDENGKPMDIEAEGLFACVVQHEIDHLYGRLIVDYASFLDKIRISRKLEEFKKRIDDEKLPESKTKSCQLQL